MILLDIDILASGTEIKTKIGAPQPYKHSSGGGGVASGPQQGISPPKPQMNGHGRLSTLVLLFFFLLYF